MRIKSITPAGRADVFNMEVSDTHNFVIQGGMIAHNCADEVRYFLMSRPIKPRYSKERDTYFDSPQAVYLDIPKEDIMPKRTRERMEIIG